MQPPFTLSATIVRLHLRIWFILLLAQPVVLYCQSVHNGIETLVDVFPLSQGNEWKYRYFTDNGIWPAGNPGQSSTDSGEVTYLVTGRTSSIDSTRWQLRVVRRLVRHEISWWKSRDTTFPILDTSFVDLIERNQGQHQVYVLGDPNLIRMNVLPFTWDFVDTTLIFRFRAVGAGDTTVFLSCVHVPSAPTFRSTFDNYIRSTVTGGPALVCSPLSELPQSR